MATIEIDNLRATQADHAARPDQRPVVFLDIDDVLCVHRTLNTRQVLAVLAGDETIDAAEVWQQIFHRHAVENLRQLHNEFRPWYVISSSWTLHLSREQLSVTFKATELGFVADNLHMAWCTPRDEDSYRLVEIDAWLDTSKRHGSRQLVPAAYVIIDDVLSGQSLVGSHLEGHTVFCEASSGFLFPQLNTAREILSLDYRDI